MANEILKSISLQAAKVNYSFQKAIRGNMAGSHKTANVQDIPNTATAVTIGPGIASAGEGIFTNLDPTNYIDLGILVSSTFYPLVRLLPGDVHAFRLSTLTFWAKASAGTPALSFEILEG